MSDYQDCPPAPETNPARLQICLFAFHPQLSERVGKLLNSKRFELRSFDTIENLLDYTLVNYEQIDCLVLTLSDRLGWIWNQLWQAKILLPTVILLGEHSLTAADKLEQQLAGSDSEAEKIYHQAEIQLYPTQIEEINSYINLAIDKFIGLTPNAAEFENTLEAESSKNTAPRSLIAQQQRLTEKLTERLSYLGFFYRRNPNHFWINLPQEQQTEFLQEISREYRQILLLYFDRDTKIERLIDRFVDRTFFANISTSQILEIHMELMDDFAHQLQIEGRNDDILLDYRLPLIDVISHLCEIYRRSVPNASASMNLLSAVE